MRHPIYFIPLVTSVVALIFAVLVLRRFWERRSLHLLWWGIGLVTYGAGALTESLTALFGWHEGWFRAWYITAVLLGIAPFAQGSAYLHLDRRTADRLTCVVGGVISLVACLVLLSPIEYGRIEPYRLSGAVLRWDWLRSFSPLIGLYAAAMLIGGAVIGAKRYLSTHSAYYRSVGSMLVAVGALSPIIADLLSRPDQVDAPYVTQLIGMVFIFAGYRLTARYVRTIEAERVGLIMPRTSPRAHITASRAERLATKV